MVKAWPDEVPLRVVAVKRRGDTIGMVAATRHLVIWRRGSVLLGDIRYWLCAFASRNVAVTRS